MGGKGFSKGGYVCRTCGQVGHRAFECVSAALESSAAGCKGTAKGSRGTVCRSCGGAGHRYFECPQADSAQAALVVVPPPAHWASILQIKQKHMKKSLARPAYPHISILTSAPAAHLEAAKAIGE